MTSKVLARWDAIIAAITERLEKTVARLAKDTAILTDTGVFDGLIEDRYNLAARVYCIKHLRELLEVHVVAVAHKEMLTAMNREIVNQSTNERLHLAYKKALVEMYQDLQFAVGV